MFAFSCDFPPYDFKTDHGNRFLSKIRRGTFFPILNKNPGCRDIPVFVQTHRFFPSLHQIYRGVAKKILEISVGVSNMLSKYFLFPLTRGSLAWLKFRQIRFLSQVIAKKPHWTNCFGRTTHESSHKHQAASCNVHRNPLLTRTTQGVRAPAVFAFGVGGVCVRNKPVRTSIGRTGGCRWGFHTSRGGLEGEELSHRSHAQSREEAQRFQRHLPL